MPTAKKSVSLRNPRSKTNPALLTAEHIKLFSSVRVLFFDIDDTFSGGREQTRILSEAYDALWRLKSAGVRIVPVTGRPAGWCDMIARMWPVDAVIGENGAFYCFVKANKGKSKFVKVYTEPKAIRLGNQKKLEALKNALCVWDPKLCFASDQRYREFDLAIDYCEDVTRWKPKKVEALLHYCRNQGAVAKLSSIHVNTWFGRYDKLGCVENYLKQVCSTSLKRANQKGFVAYVGDSPNDEPFFRAFRLSVGVANVSHFLEQMSARPRFITKKESGLGFCEFAEVILRAKSK